MFLIFGTQERVFDIVSDGIAFTFSTHTHIHRMFSVLFQYERGTSFTFDLFEERLLDREMTKKEKEELIK